MVADEVRNLAANSAATEESAEISKKLSDEANTLNRLIGQFHIE